MKKNAAMDSERYATLAGKLEFFDLRELQDTITSKALWARFEELSANKETFVSKLDRLAELRNGIRHGRTVDQVTQKEGEAALLGSSRSYGGGSRRRRFRTSASRSAGRFVR